MYDIRNISIYMNDIHSRYYVDTNGVFYTSISQETHKVMINGVRYNTRSIKNTLMSSLNRTTKQLVLLPIKNNKKYFLMYDGTILQRLYTKVQSNNRIAVCLMTVGKKHGVYKEVSRIIAACYIGAVCGMEVHHKDGDPHNNSIDNLEILTFEEHRSKDRIRHLK